MINSKERKEMVSDAFMWPYGYLFERRGSNGKRKQNFLYVFIICLIANQYFHEMKVVEHKINEYCKNFQGKNEELIYFSTQSDFSTVFVLVYSSVHSAFCCYSAFLRNTSVACSDYTSEHSGNPLFAYFLIFFNAFDCFKDNTWHFSSDLGDM